MRSPEKKINHSKNQICLKTFVCKIWTNLPPHRLDLKFFLARNVAKESKVTKAHLKHHWQSQRKERASRWAHTPELLSPRWASVTADTQRCDYSVCPLSSCASGSRTVMKQLQALLFSGGKDATAAATWNGCSDAPSQLAARRGFGGENLNPTNTAHMRLQESTMHPHHTCTWATNLFCQCAKVGFWKTLTSSEEQSITNITVAGLITTHSELVM